MSRIDWWAVSDESVHPVSRSQQYTIEALAEKTYATKKKSYYGDMVESGNGS